MGVSAPSLHRESTDSLINLFHDQIVDVKWSGRSLSLLFSANNHILAFGSIILEIIFLDPMVQIINILLKPTKVMNISDGMIEEKVISI